MMGKFLSFNNKSSRLLPAVLLSTMFAASSHACDLGSINFDNKFSGASSDKMIASCKASDDQITLTFQPENRPINNSPWYAFKLSSKQEKQIKVRLAVKDGKHRYPPKLSADGKTWNPIDYKAGDRYLTFRVNLTEKPVWIAGQEVINNQDYIDWGEKISQKVHITHDLLGHSVEKRPIYKIESADMSKAKPWLVVLGRQHPPELTGALALFPFVSTLLSDSQLATVFRKYYNIVIVPNMNPDGVEWGHWRHNANGVDLNRDWSKFKQPEVIAVDKYLTELVNKGHKMSMAVDFHSTHKDIFYTMPSDYGMQQPYLVNNWLNKLDNQYENFSVIQQPGNNPGRGVFKQYFADKFDVHAITYEMGDNTDRAFIRKLAIDAANSLMKTMLQDNNSLKEINK